MKVGIIGNGWVGKAMQDLFPGSITYIRDYQKALRAGELLEDVGYTEDKEKINEADIVFICVPTPNKKSINIDKKEWAEGELDTSIVEECIKWCTAELLVVRSTVNPGDCEKWAMMHGKNIVMQPEYLGETPSHPLLDTKLTNFIILGGDKKWTRKLIELYSNVYNANINIRQVSLREAEVIKLSENRSIAFRVAEAQELYDVCQKAGVDYYEIRQAVYGDDPRMQLWWTFVYPENRGFKSKCIPKDVYAWAAWAESLGYNPEITRAIVNKNKEWINEGTS